MDPVKFWHTPSYYFRYSYWGWGMGGGCDPSN